MAKRKKKHEIELYPYETFKTLFEYEIRRSRRYNDPVTLVRLAVETENGGAEPQHGAEVFTINILDVHLRDVDIPCRVGNEFLVLMPCTDELSGRVVCERLESFFRLESEVYEKVSLKLNVFIGMISLPSNKSLSSKRLMEGASRALEHARTNQQTKTVVFSDINQPKE